MVLFCVVGELGAGKTLADVSLAFKNWYTRRRVVFSNLHLYQIPYQFIQGIDQLNLCREGFVAVDELWSICDARMSTSTKNKITADILLRSRKRELIYCVTSQLLELLDRRVRKVLDFTAYPILNRNETVCKINIFRTGFPKPGTYLNTMYFWTDEIFRMFDTNEEIDMVEEANEPMGIRFQPNFNREHGNFCECKECGGLTFDNWEEADKHAEAYWKERFLEKPELKIF